jgi:GT2 family glycosyltransferase
MSGESQFFTVSGWGSPLPILVRANDAAELAKMRANIELDISRLLVRCLELDACLPEHLSQHKAYLNSKQVRHFNLSIQRVASPPTAEGLSLDPPPLLRLLRPDDDAIRLDMLLSSPENVVCVGEITEPSLKATIGERIEKIQSVASGDGDLIVLPNGNRRAAGDSFSEWLAMREEAERAKVNTFILTRHAQRKDVELLRYRVHSRQKILVEAGSPALFPLLIDWGGICAREGDLFLFSEPAGYFREISARCQLGRTESWPRISVVTVSYNQHDYLEQCLRSVLDQQYPNLEYIVVDPGSTDGSRELLLRFQDRYGCFSKLIFELDDGQSDGLTKGFKCASGEILTWVNSDDMLAPLSLKRAAMTLVSSGADLVAGTCNRVSGQGGELIFKHHAALTTLNVNTFDLSGPLSWCESWEKGDYFFQPEVFFTRAVWDRSGAYLKPHLHWAMDWDFWLRCALTGAKIVRIPDVLGISREHAAQKTTSQEMYLWQIVGILREFDSLLAAVGGQVDLAGI